MDNEFNARLCMECRNVSWSLSLTGVRARSKNEGATATSIGPFQIQGIWLPKACADEAQTTESLLGFQSRDGGGTKLWCIEFTPAYLIGLAKTDRRPGIYLKPKKDRTATTTTTRPTM
ncbi:hypothetical protein SAMN02927895_02290 [Belnapia rosea]|nr:hypothetical protein SAMN02927895_02290 [Belnapia rosea]